MVTVTQNADGTLDLSGFAGLPDVQIIEAGVGVLRVAVPGETIALLPSIADIAALQAKIDKAKADLS